MNILIRGFVSPDTNTCSCDCNCNCNAVCTPDLSGYPSQLDCARAGKYNWCSCDSPGGYMQY